MMIAAALVAVATAPTASACQYTGPAGETVNYVRPCSSFGARDNAEAAVAFAQEEADRVVDFALETVNDVPLP